MKLRSPSGCGAVSHAGLAITLDCDGCVEVDAETAADLLVHGFVFLQETEAPPQAVLTTPDPSPPMAQQIRTIDRLKRGELFALLKANGVSAALPISNEELRALARKCIGGIIDELTSHDTTKGS